MEYIEIITEEELHEALVDLVLRRNNKTLDDAKAKGSVTSSVKMRQVTVGGASSTVLAVTVRSERSRSSKPESAAEV